MLCFGGRSLSAAPAPRLSPSRRRDRAVAPVPQLVKTMAKRFRTFALALFHIPFHIRAFTVAPYHLIQNQVKNRASVCCASAIQFRDILRKNLASTGVKSISTLSSSRCLSYRLHADNMRFISKAAVNDAFTEQQHWLDLRRSVQLLEPKYRYDSASTCR